MKSVPVLCAYCGKKFMRPKSRFQEAEKFGWRQFCSNTCQFKAKTKSVMRICGNPSCGRTLLCTSHQLENSKSGRVFCSSSCSITVSNRDRSKYSTKTCPMCGMHITVKKWKTYCSRTCAAESRRQTKEQFQMNAGKQIQEFYEKHGRIPTKRERYGLYTTARRGFGTWNKAIAASGFKTNPVLFAHRYRSKDGHMCDSFTEKIIDDWLYEHGIPHEVHIPYPAQSKLKTDFVVRGWFIEFFGLNGENDVYTETVRRKQELTEQWEIPLIEIYPKDIFPDSNLEEIFAPLLNQ